MNRNLILFLVLSHLQPDTFFSIQMLHGSHGIVNQIGNHLTKFPGFHGKFRKLSGHFEIKIYPQPLCCFQLCLKQSIDRRLRCLHCPADFHNIFENRSHVIPGFLIFFQFQKTIDNLHLIQIIVPLLPQLTVQLFQIFHTFPITTVLIMSKGKQSANRQQTAKQHQSQCQAQYKIRLFK